MSDAYWQAKIWGLLHDPNFKPLHDNTGRGGNSFWKQLPIMQDWVENGLNPEDSSKKILEHIKLADYITSASDRGAIGSVSSSVNYNKNGLEISHLLSGAKQTFKLKGDRHQELLSDRKRILEEKENRLFQAIPESIKNDVNNPKKLFWWLWRCLPEAVCQEFDDYSLLLTPAETRLPDSSIWSHASLTAAIAGALAGYDLTTEEIKEKWNTKKTLSHAYIASFTFSPIQELIKASRKMRDFWAGSWILHYLSAKVCWELAQQYGADCILYPSLYQQPLIDLWLLEKYPEFQPWIDPEKDYESRNRALLTAGFPNVIVLVLPKDKVNAAMQRAKSVLVDENWRKIGNLAFDELKERNWQPDLNYNSNTWKGWLESQWQTYWTAVPIGKEGEELKNAAIPKEREEEFKQWLDTQNQAYAIEDKKNKLFQQAEINFLREAYRQRLERQGRKFSVNVGSWWNHAFNQTRLALTAVKNARDWEIPTAFATRSTISGLGAVVHPPSKEYPNTDWITEGEAKQAWKREASLFDGREQLNATETVKRVLTEILPKLLRKNRKDKRHDR
jgi:CRISPR-associated protein Cmr2